MRLDGIIASMGSFPPLEPIVMTEPIFNEAVLVYHEFYAPGLAAFFETKWFGFRYQGRNTFPRDVPVAMQLASFLQFLGRSKDVEETEITCEVFETSLIWRLARLAYSTMPRMNSGSTVLPPKDDATETRNRVYVVEVLLSGEHLSANPLTAPLPDPDAHRVREFEFWHTLGDFVCLRGGTPQQQDQILARLRKFLDGRENRDLLYSVAVIRAIGPRLEPGADRKVPQHLDESSQHNKLVVASRFVRNEALGTGGTTNVARRFSATASKAFLEQRAAPKQGQTTKST